MNKDALLATAIGFVIGLIITGLLLIGPSIASKLPKMSFKLPAFPTGQPRQPDSNAKQTNTAFTIDSPLTDAIESEKEILISGKAKPGSTIVITGVINDTAILASDDGTYAGKILLIEGKNDITVVQNDKVAISSASITVFYTPESL